MTHLMEYYPERCVYTEVTCIECTVQEKKKKKVLR